MYNMRRGGRPGRSYTGGDRRDGRVERERIQ